MSIIKRKQLLDMCRDGSISKLRPLFLHQPSTHICFTEVEFTKFDEAKQTITFNFAGTNSYKEVSVKFISESLNTFDVDFIVAVDVEESLFLDIKEFIESFGDEVKKKFFISLPISLMFFEAEIEKPKGTVISFNMNGVYEVDLSLLGKSTDRLRILKKY